MAEVEVSVIITAYNRRKYLEEAVKSVLTQTIDKERYEIIVLKNFADKDLDFWLNENGVRVNNLPDLPVGEYLYHGIIASKANIISFLDDDDLFYPTKLEYLVSLFKKHPNLGFYHNSYDTVDGKGNRIHRKTDSKMMGGMVYMPGQEAQYKVRKFMAIRANSNMSSISIRKEALQKSMPSLRALETNQDTFVFFSSVLSGLDLFADIKNLNTYRIHDSTSHMLKYDESRMDRMLSLENMLLNSYKILNELSRESPSNSFVKCKLLQSKFTAYFLGENSIYLDFNDFIDFGKCVCIRRKIFPLFFAMNFILSKFSLLGARKLFRRILNTLP